MVSTSPDRTMVTSTSRPNATLRGKRTASLFPLRKVRLSATAILAISFVITRIYEMFLGFARSGYVRAGSTPKWLILWTFYKAYGARHSDLVPAVCLSLIH